MKAPDLSRKLAITAVFALLGLLLAAGSAGALTIVNQGPGAVNNFPPGNVVSVAVTTDITRGTTISWGLQGGTGNLGLGTITIPVNQTVGFGSGAVPAGAVPGNYTLFAQEGTNQATGGQIVVQGPPPQPTQPPVLTHVENNDVTTIQGIYISKKTEVEIRGTCQYSGETIEIMLDGQLVGSVYSTGQNWGYTITVPADEQPHRISARNAAGDSTVVNVQIDIKNPTFEITYNPSSPFGETTVTVRVTASEDVKDLNLSAVLPDGSPALIEMTLIGTGDSGRVWEGKMEITVQNGNPAVNGVNTINGTARMVISAFDLAQPGGNLGTAITSGEQFIIQVSGPSASNARVVVENNAQYINRRNLRFTWEGFTHPLGQDSITTYWYKAIKEGEPAPDPANSSDTSGWTSFPAATGTTQYSSTLNVTEDGTFAVHVKAEDRLNKFSGTAFDEIIVDATGPAAQNPNPANAASVLDVQQTVSVELVEVASGLDRNTVQINILGVDYGLSGSNNPNASPAMRMFPKQGEAGTWVIVFDPKLINLKWPRGQVTCTLPNTIVDNVGNALGGTAGSPGQPFSWTFNVDINGDAPIAQNGRPSGLYVKNKRQPIRIELLDEDGIDDASVQLDVAGSSYNPTTDTALTLQGPTGGGSISVLLFTPPADMPDGTVAVVLRKCKDKVGNSISSPYEFSFWVDTTGPKATDPAPGAGITVENPNNMVSVRIEDELSGVDQTVEINVQYQPTYSATVTYNQNFDTGNAALSYNPSTRTLSFNPQAANANFGQGSVTVSILRAGDRAVTINLEDGTTTPAPNALQNAPYAWTYFIGSNVGPVFSDPLPANDALSNLDPLVVRFVLADPDFIDHASLIFDFNGRTFRDGDLGISWDLGTSSVLTGTHEVVVFDPPDELIKQATNEIRVRAAKDRRGNALQNAPVTYRFRYDSEGPKVDAGTIIPKAVIYDRKQVVSFDLTDNFSGIDPSTIMLRIQVDATTSDFGTGTDPAVLQYIPADATGLRGNVRFNPPADFSFQSGKTYNFTVRAGTRDRAGNRLQKAIGSPSQNHTGTDYTFSLRVAASTEVVLLEYPTDKSWVNTTDSSKFRFQWKAPSGGASAYELVVSDNVNFDDQAPSKVWRFSTTSTTYRDETFGVILQHGNTYYWYVDAVDNSATPPHHYAKSRIWQFTVDNVPPTTPDIRAITDYRDIEPDHINWNPYSTTTYVKNRSIRVQVYCYESGLETQGYTLSIYNVIDSGGTCGEECLIGTLDKPICQYTNEVDITLPTKDSMYHLVARIRDRADNYSLTTPIAKVYLDTTRPKVEAVTITDMSPNSNGYITSGEAWIEVKFFDAVGLLPLDQYKVKPTIRVDPGGPGKGTGPVEVGQLSIAGKSLKGKIVLPFGQSSYYDGMADVHVLGVMDEAYNVMEGNYFVQEDVFEIDTAPSFEVRTFLNPVDEKNVLINIYASETLLQAPTLWINNSAGVSRNVKVTIMERNLFAATWGSVVGTHEVRVSGPDAKGNIGYFPTHDSLQQSTFLSYNIARSAPGRMVDETMGLAIETPSGAVGQDTLIHAFPWKPVWGEEALALPARMSARCEVEELQVAGPRFQLSPDRVRFRKPVTIRLTAPERLSEERLRRVGIYVSSDGQRFQWIPAIRQGRQFSGQIDRACILGLYEDCQAPQLDEASLQDGQTVETDRPRLEMRIRDLGAGVDASTIRLLLNGERVDVHYDAASGLMSWEPESGLPAGSYQLQLEVADRAGNASPQRTIAINVPKTAGGIERLVAYPNPATTLTTIRFALGGVALGEAESVDLRVYDGGGRLVRKLDALKGAGGLYRALWDLRDGRGRAVANGTYFYRVRANVGDKRLQKSGKIAVLR